jgi:hypothetical protein
VNRAEPEPRTYRFGPRDRTGWLLGLQGSQCVAIATGILTGGVILNAGAALPVACVPLLVGVVAAFGRWNGQAVLEVVPTLLSWQATRFMGAARWRAELPRLRIANHGATAAQPDLPPVLRGLTIHEAVDAEWSRRGRTATAGIVRDPAERTATVVLRVRGQGFALCDRAEQERLLHLWGDALSTYCTERQPISRLRWTEWAAPAGLDGQLAYLAERGAAATDAGPAVDAYRELLEQAGPIATRHEVLIALTADERRTPRRGSRPTDRVNAIEHVVVEQARLLSGRLETAGLSVDLPLTPAELAGVWRARLDPFAAPTVRSGRRRSLVELAGLASVANAGPLSVDEERDFVRVDGALHVAYVIAEWPRLEVPPAWMEPLLLHAGGVRSIAVHYEPVAPSRSQRTIERQSVKLSTDEEQRARSGFRIGARHRRQHAELQARESELVAGYGEFEYVGFVIVTAPDRDTLEQSCAEYEQVAAQAGLELRRLDGRHQLALACGLPIGRGVAGRRLA